MLRIYYADVSALDPEREYTLSKYRCERLACVRQGASRRGGLGAELLLNHAVKNWRDGFPLPLDIVTLEHGKPALRGGEFFIGLSHSGTYAAAAVCDRDFGLDLQRNTPPNPALVRRFFSADEQKYIAQAEDGEYAFTEIWCKKESYIKALGTGLATPLASFSVIGMQGIWHCTLDGYHLAVCIPCRAVIRPDVIEKTELL